MKVLIACEFSGIVRDAFIAKGHAAMSCDLLPTERPGPHHLGDVLEILDQSKARYGKLWDMMIAFPPCTYISYAATHVWNKPGRCEKRLEALEFFRQLYEAPIEKICIENPKGCASPTIAKYSQEIQPYYFGDCQMKTTWLWLRNLPLLHHSTGDLFDENTHTEKPEPIDYKPDGGPRYYTEALKGKDRQKERARFWPGIAKAMADQWG